MFAKTTGRNWETTLTNQLNKVAAQPVREIWRRCFRKARTPSSATIGKECELADNKDGPSGFVHRQIHFALLVFKDPQSEDLFGKRLGILLCVTDRNTKKNE